VAARRTWIWLVIGAAIGIAALSMFGDVRGLGASLDGFEWGAFAACIGLACANYAIRWTRFELYLRRQGARVPLASSAIVFGAGLSLAITPAKMGELVKCYLLRDMHGVPVTQTAPVIVAERVTDLIALLLIAVIGVAVYGVGVAVLVTAAAVVAVLFVLLATPRLTTALVELATRPRAVQRFRAPLLDLYGGLATLCHPRTLVPATVIAVPAWACESIGFGLIVNAFPGTHCDLGLAMVIYAATTIAGALSFLPGGLGVTEGTMTLLLVRGAAHVAQSTATAATLLARLATLWFAVALGLVFVAAARRRTRRLVA
jgi:uncharacterized protein (TIRG00374 family)